MRREKLRKRERSKEAQKGWRVNTRAISCTRVITFLHLELDFRNCEKVIIGRIVLMAKVILETDYPSKQ